MPMKPEVVILTPCPDPLPTCLCDTQLIVDGNIVIPPQKPEKEQIIEFRVSVEVTKWDVIDLPGARCKVVVSGVVHVGLEYVANLPEQPVHFSHWDIPWHTFCEIADCTATPPTTATACVEYADYEQIDHRTLSKIIVLYICVA